MKSILLSQIFLFCCSAWAQGTTAPPPPKGDGLKSYCQKYPTEMVCKPNQANEKLDQARKLQDKKAEEQLKGLEN
ncbi:MAG: hypothetical protein ACAH59_13350 [Pseudobdellovibrionaceae bacterium]